MFRNASRFLLPVGLALSVLLGGCTYPSSEKEFASVDTGTPTETPGKEAGAVAAKRLQDALAKAESDPAAQKFWYSGYVKNTILSRTTTSMFDGIVVRPDGYLVNARIAAKPYQYYRYQDKSYLRSGDYWLTAREEPLPFDVWTGYTEWLPFLDKAVQLPDEAIIGVKSTPYQIKISGEEWVTKNNISFFGPLQKELEGRADLRDLLKQTTVKMTIWIGEDGLIHQYQTWIIVPLPGAGLMDQEVKYTMFKYDDPGIKLPEISEIEKYLLY